MQTLHSGSDLGKSMDVQAATVAASKGIIGEVALSTLVNAMIVVQRSAEEGKDALRDANLQEAQAKLLKLTSAMEQAKRTLGNGGRA